MIAAVRVALNKQNPKIVQVGVIGMRALAAQAQAPHVVIGYGVRGDLTSVEIPDFRDELYGIFIFDPALTHIQRTLAIIPTPRWLEYDMWIADVDFGIVTIRGKGATYNDSPNTWKFRLP